MKVTGKYKVELESYHLNDIPHIWFTQQNENRVMDGTYVTRECFTWLLFDRFFLR